MLAFSYVVPITVAMVVVLAILMFSYRQTIKAYPSAGGAYIVTKDNLGLLPAQVAGVALLTDYVLTVSVSVSAGTAALYSAVPGTYAWRVPIALAFIALIAWGNLRGVKESGKLFAAPTYCFVVVGAGHHRHRPRAGRRPATCRSHPAQRSRAARAAASYGSSCCSTPSPRAAPP